MGESQPQAEIYITMAPLTCGQIKQHYCREESTRTSHDVRRGVSTQLFGFVFSVQTVGDVVAEILGRKTEEVGVAAARRDVTSTAAQVRRFVTAL